VKKQYQEYKKSIPIGMDFEVSLSGSAGVIEDIVDIK
jgi:hypothetical protein